VEEGSLHGSKFPANVSLVAFCSWTGTLFNHKSSPSDLELGGLAMFPIAFSCLGINFLSLLQPPCPREHSRSNPSGVLTKLSNASQNRVGQSKPSVQLLALLLYAVWVENHCQILNRPFGPESRTDGPTGSQWSARPPIVRSNSKSTGPLSPSKAVESWEKQLGFRQFSPCLLLQRISGYIYQSVFSSQKSFTASPTCQ
jgi:hypothetical protein